MCGRLGREREKKREDRRVSVMARVDGVHRPENG
jgi:hypothetical protein